MANWNIDNKSSSPTCGNDLEDLTIVALSPSGYQLTNSSGVVATSRSMTFNDVTYKGYIWDIVAKSLPAAANGHGTWTRKGEASTGGGKKGVASRMGGDDIMGGENGEFTAQAGSGVGPDPKDPEERKKKTASSTRT